MAIFNSYVKLPEGRLKVQHVCAECMWYYLQRVMTCHDSTDLSVSRCFHRARSEFLCAATITESPALMRGTIFSCWKAMGTGEIQKSLWPFIKGSGQLIIESQQEVFIFVTMGGANQQTPPTSTVQAVFGDVFASCPPSNRFVFFVQEQMSTGNSGFCILKKNRSFQCGTTRFTVHASDSPPGGNSSGATPAYFGSCTGCLGS